MVHVGLLVRLEAKPGKEAEMESFLTGGLALAEQEPATTVWFAIRMGPSTFGIFDAFPDDTGRQAHLTGPIAAALMAKAPDLLARPPVIEKVDVLAAGSTAMALTSNPTLFCHRVVLPSAESLVTRKAGGEASDVPGMIENV